MPQMLAALNNCQVYVLLSEARHLAGRGASWIQGVCSGSTALGFDSFTLVCLLVFVSVLDLPFPARFEFHTLPGLTSRTPNDTASLLTPPPSAHSNPTIQTLLAFLNMDHLPYNAEQPVAGKTSHSTTFIPLFLLP